MRQLGLLLVTMALFAAACGAEGSVFDLSVGDCFDAPQTEEVSNVEVVDCATPHDHEVFLLFDLDGDDFPGTDDVARQASDACLSGFDAYVGNLYADSTLDIGFLPPSEATWDDGDREVVCYLLNFTGGQLTAGARDSGL